MAGERMESIAGLPRIVGGAIEDIRKIAQGMGALPELVKILTTIETRVQLIEADVAKMRRAVEKIDGDVGTLPDQIAALEDSIPLRRRRRQSTGS